MIVQPVFLRSIHVDGPQPGYRAAVRSVVWRADGQLCYEAYFANGQQWIVPLMAIKDFELIQPN